MLQISVYFYTVILVLLNMKRTMAGPRPLEPVSNEETNYFIKIQNSTAVIHTTVFLNNVIKLEAYKKVFTYLTYLVN